MAVRRAVLQARARIPLARRALAGAGRAAARRTVGVMPSGSVSMYSTPFSTYCSMTMYTRTCSLSEKSSRTSVNNVLVGFAK